MNHQRDHVLNHMKKLWTNWRGSLHKYVKFKPLHEDLNGVPKEVDKSDWEWLVKEHFLSENFKAEIQELVQSEPSLTNIEVIERCFGPQNKSHVVGLGGGITTKELKGGSSSKAAILIELNATRKEKESLQTELNATKKAKDSLEKCMDDFESKYDHLISLLVDQPSSTPSTSQQSTS
ncbi:hypothetical protein A4A49_10965 [Nicotiana attenuata]|uniref:Uncharacterized protein n=1 Tax=Nicotiana attenuata TaxID=49451 RepID=A0A1J6ICI2_NICAT|nr:hypothetical protein A4A49_10965 [Nicotiana attenuata]